jgi:hypothetical protein
MYLRKMMRATRPASRKMVQTIIMIGMMVAGRIGVAAAELLATVGVIVGGLVVDSLTTWRVVRSLL